MRPSRWVSGVALLGASVLTGALVVSISDGSASDGSVSLASAVAQRPKRCPSGSAAAFTYDRFVCLKPGQKCRRDRWWESEYRHAGLHCHTGRLTRPKATHVMRKVDVGGFRLAISCQGSGTPTVVLESGSRASSGAWMLLQPRAAK